MTDEWLPPSGGSRCADPESRRLCSRPPFDLEQIFAIKTRIRPEYRLMDASRRDDSPQFESGHLLDVLIVAGLLALPVLVIAGNVDTKTNDRFSGGYFIYIGLLFLASYYWSDKSVVLRGFMWICENFSNPRSRKMAFFYFALSLAFGLITLLGG
jgi:hypothetical protein